MMSTMILLARVEQARHKLHVLVQEYGELGHPKVIKQSQILDELINNYYRKKEINIKKPIA